VTAAGDHTHEGGPDDGAYDWFKILDIVVWVSVALITCMAVEWLIGVVVRERISRGAARHLAKVGAPSVPDSPTA